MTIAKFKTIRNSGKQSVADWPDQTFIEQPAEIRGHSDLPGAADEILIPELDIRVQPDLIRIYSESNARLNQKSLFIGVLILSSVVVLISIIFALFGAWLILPFAGMEILLLATGAMIAGSHAHDADLLVISQKHVHLTKRRRSNRSVNSYVRHWTYASMEAGKTGHEPSRLLLGSHGENQEIGEYLTESSKRILCQQLIKWIRNDV